MPKHITVKTADEIAKMQAAGRVVEEVLLAIQRLVRPGITTLELDAVAASVIRQHGARASFLGYEGAAGLGFPGSICASVNEAVVHGIPSRRRLKEGDILSVDVGAELDGWHGDAARTFFVGRVSPEVRKLVQVTRECFFEGAKQARPGNRLGDIALAVQTHAHNHGYGVVRVLVGHGIGRAMHEAPDVPNYVLPGRGRGLRLTPGMTLAIEPMINMGTHEVRTLPDKWTVVTKDGKPSAHYENTLAITDGDPLILTLTREEQGSESNPEANPETYL